MKKQLSSLLICASALLILMNSCQKELSFENGNSQSEGSLQDDGTGNCLPKTVNGTYIATTTLDPATNTIDVSVNVTKTGAYKIYSDTINGYYFIASGIFAATGINQVTLKGNGTPIASGINNFLIIYDSSACTVPVNVLPVGAGGPATFTLAGTPGNCSGAVVNGSYSTGTALNSFNTVVISVDVTAIGTYNISTTAVNGMTFTGSGSFATTGTQTITLNGTGTPSTGGNTSIPITAGSSSCSFTINVGSPAVGTLGGSPGSCTSATLNGSYYQTSTLTSSNTVQIQVNITTVGVYTISTDTVSGIYFAAAGSFTTMGTQIVTLNGFGAPTINGDITLTVKFGTSSCTFVVHVQPIDYFPRTTNSNWSYEFSDVSSDSVLINVIPNTLSAIGNNYNIFMGTNGSGSDTSGYYRRSGGDYYHYTNLADYLGLDNPQWVEFVFLKDNQPSSTVWYSNNYSGTLSGNAITVRIKFTILQKDVPISISTSTGNVTYPNTIVVEEEYEAFDGTNWIPLDPYWGYYKDYYVRNVGWILDEYYDPTAPQPDKFAMRRYQVF